MNIESLKAFCAVYEQGSLAKAARKLGVTTPKMTRWIQQVESELNTKLLHRTTRALTSTEAGELFYQQIKEIIYQYDSSVSSLQTLTTHISVHAKNRDSLLDQLPLDNPNTETIHSAIPRAQAQYRDWQPPTRCTN